MISPVDNEYKSVEHAFNSELGPMKTPNDVICASTVVDYRLNEFARESAGPNTSKKLALLLQLENLLRELGLQFLDTNETVIPFSKFENGCLVPYPDNLATVALQIINPDNTPSDEYIHIFEEFEISRVKC